ncbi:hypothetical protein KSP40_PGU013334 [Platanthera guangdongensis]|uniref:Uncharacterized protein n=1 Tax=Platanthera guangdongensis TaxID=2320717 RepID=A0ABR2LJ40_9ASPA
MDDDEEDEGHKGHEVFEAPDPVEPPSDKPAPVEGETETSKEAASIPPLETVIVSSSTDASAEEQGQEVPPTLPLRDELAAHTVNVIQGIVNELKDSFANAQNKLLKRIKTSENLMLKNMVEINHKLDVMDKKFEEKYTAAGEAVTLLMAGLKKNTDTLAIVNQNAHVVANNIQTFDGNMVTLNANQQALSNKYVYESCRWMLHQALGIPLAENPADIHPPETSMAVEGVSDAERISASAADVPISEADARALSKAKLRSMFDQEALAKAKAKRKAQEGTSKETPAEKRIRMSEEDVRNEKWSPVSRNIILDTFWLQERGEINRNEVYSQYEWETHKTFEAKRNIFFRNNKDADKVPPPRYYPKPKEYMERQSKKYLAQNPKAPLPICVELVYSHALPGHFCCFLLLPPTHMRLSQILTAVQTKILQALAPFLLPGHLRLRLSLLAITSQVLGEVVSSPRPLSSPTAAPLRYRHHHMSSKRAAFVHLPSPPLVPQQVPSLRRLWSVLQWSVRAAKAALICVQKAARNRGHVIENPRRWPLKMTGVFGAAGEDPVNPSSFAFLSSFHSNLVVGGLSRQVGWGHAWNRFAGPLSCRHQPHQCAFTPLLPFAWGDTKWQSPVPRDIRRLQAYGVELTENGQVNRQCSRNFLQKEKRTYQNRSCLWFFVRQYLLYLVLSISS